MMIDNIYRACKPALINLYLLIHLIFIASYAFNTIIYLDLKWETVVKRGLVMSTRSCNWETIKTGAKKAHAVSV